MRFSSAIAAQLRALHRETHGSVMIIVAASLIVMMLLLGASVDMGRAYMVRSKMASASDAAALGAAAYAKNDGADPAHWETWTDPVTGKLHIGYKQKALEYYTANFPCGFLESSYQIEGGTGNCSLGGGDDVVVTYTQAYSSLLDRYYVDSITINSSAKTPSIFLKLVSSSFNTVNASNHAKVGIRPGALEVALVLDITQSMSGSPMNDGLKPAALDLLDVIYSSANTVADTYVGVVPYGVAVNIGTNHDGWVDWHNDADPTKDYSRWRFGSRGWGGCVEAYGVRGSNEQIDADAMADPAGKFLPFLYRPGGLNRWSMGYLEPGQTLNTNDVSSLGYKYIGSTPIIAGAQGVVLGDADHVDRGDNWSSNWQQPVGSPPTSWTAITTDWNDGANPWYGASPPRYPMYDEWTAHIVNYTSGGTTWPNATLGDSHWDVAMTHGTDAYNVVGANVACPRNPILPLTKEKDTVADAIKNLLIRARGGTLGDQGMIWGWHLLQPTWRAAWGNIDAPNLVPHNYDTNPVSQQEVHKVMLFMTDGHNELSHADYTSHKQFADSDQNLVDISLYGGDFTRIKEASLDKADNLQWAGGPNWNPNASESNNSICGKMKAQGITIFTVIFAPEFAFDASGNPDPSKPNPGRTRSNGTWQPLKELYRGCASPVPGGLAGEKYYYHPKDNEELRQAFHEIGMRIRTISVTQ